MTHKNFWTGLMVTAGVLTAGMGWAMLGLNSGCRGHSEKPSASGGQGSASTKGEMEHPQGRHHHMEGEHGAAGHGQAAARSEKRPPSIFDSPPPEGTKAYCPVMKKTFFVTKNSPRTRYKGKWVYFCCSSCKGKFEANPEAYLN